MLIRLRRPWRARLIVALTALVLTAGGVALILWGETPPPFPPLPKLPAAHGNVVIQVAVETTLDRDAPPAPATLCGAVLLSVAGALCLAGCLIGRRR
ncbi:hypothetical protein HEP86_24270 [Streptomyces sp. RPA4-5]|uniref:hypothetical protein n=1 Tax=Streptomyces TaxID=1883 RepID=UPI00143E4B1E|nr:MULTISPECIES: hypothetical protein [Streptomyces]MCX4636852.1 hypothetical protein [Streptomyces platensis]QIY57068.1 hypothetical protein HEP86_24270 [Streptomyces sp. RPA4-5]WJY40089.1 hypothetical protein QT196_23985 [Streptomyces sp. P9-2B-2]WSW53920.1 hypothetical protein OG962_22350 [Streptomyces platensis]